MMANGVSVDKMVTRVDKVFEGLKDHEAFPVLKEVVERQALQDPLVLLALPVRRALGVHVAREEAPDLVDSKDLLVMLDRRVRLDLKVQMVHLVQMA